MSNTESLTKRIGFISNEKKKKPGENKRVFLDGFERKKKVEII